MDEGLSEKVVFEQKPKSKIFTMWQKTARRRRKAEMRTARSRNSQMTSVATEA